MKYITFVLFLLSSLTIHAQALTPTEKEALVKVTMTNFSKVPLKKETVILESIKTKKKYSGVTDVEGKLSLLVPKGDTYLIEYKTLLENENYSKLEVSDKEGLLTLKVTIQINPPKTYTLRNVFFDTGKSTLRTESNKALNELVEAMKMKESMTIEIAGHTDDVGDDASNQKLSEDRAKAVREYLIKHGIAATRVLAKGYGETQPVADNAAEEGRQKNRRTEVRIIKE